MEEITAPKADVALVSSPARFEIVLTDDASSLLSLVSPPLGDIEEMSQLGQAAFSLKTDGQYNNTFRTAAKHHLDSLLSKSSEFNQSSTFNNRLANAHAAIGHHGDELASAERAYRINGASFFARRLADASFKMGHDNEASSLWVRAAEEDSASSLRLAGYAIRSVDYDTAEIWVKKAVYLKPWGYSERLFEGALNLVRKDFKKAISALKIALEDRPSSSFAYTNLGFAYLGEGLSDQAYKCLKRAVALDPFNRTALLAYSDLAHRMHRDEDSISSLRYFVQFEQTWSPIWERLARSLQKIGLYDEAITALKIQGGIRSTAGVWNNLGVAYARKKDSSRAMQAFSQALHSPSEGGVRLDLLLVKNCAALVSSAGRYGEVIRMTSHVIDQDAAYSLASDSVAHEIYSLHMHALFKMGEHEEAFKMINRLLCMEGLARPLLRWIISFVCAHKGLRRDDDEGLSRFLDLFIEILDREDLRDLSVVNNLSFALAEINRVDEASYYINFVSSSFHVNPYLTATFGLINLRKGNFLKGKSLYEEAVHLATSRLDKVRIRQKMNLELARMFAFDSKKSIRYLDKVISDKGGEAAIRFQAIRMKNSTPLLR